VHAPPPASATIEALRGLGYSLGAAIADLIDNSIAAGAGNVWITAHWSGKDSFIAILDDGRGMSSAELIDVLRLGRPGPGVERSPSDLGRFGLGLKTASFSQARRVTVASRRNSAEGDAFCWDLDHVAQRDEWELLQGAAEGSARHLTALEDMESGTIVLLELLDRVVPTVEASDPMAHSHFLRQLAGVEEHLAMVFHRFLDGTTPDLRLFVNGRDDSHRVRAWDPFLSRHPATIATPIERMNAHRGSVEVQGFVLPHRRRLDEAAFAKAGGPHGWTAQQGFYVYRNRRLLLPGSWLALGGTRAWTKEEPYKLARLRLDIPNTADSDWRIDVRKSLADPPDQIRPRLRDLASYVRDTARRVFAFRGSAAPTEDSAVTYVWLPAPIGRTNQVHYKINREHPAVQLVTEQHRDLKDAVEGMLRTIEQNVPVQRIWVDAIERGEIGDRADPAAVKSALDIIFAEMIRDGRMSARDAKHQLLMIEPFHKYPELIAELDESTEGGALDA